MKLAQFSNNGTNNRPFMEILPGDDGVPGRTKFWWFQSTVRQKYAFGWFQFGNGHLPMLSELDWILKDVSG